MNIDTMKINKKGIRKIEISSIWIPILTLVRDTKLKKMEERQTWDKNLKLVRKGTERGQFALNKWNISQPETPFDHALYIDIFQIIANYWINNIIYFFILERIKKYRYNNFEIQKWIHTKWKLIRKEYVKLKVVLIEYLY